MVKLSACILTKDEEENVKRGLENIKDVVDEIIVVDGYSKDKTIEVCKKYTDKIYRHKFSGSYANERNYALSKARGNWILMIDADETFSVELKKKIRELINNRKINGYWIPRVKLIGKKYLRHGLAYPDYQLRLFLKNNTRYQGLVHEKPQIQGRVGYTKFDLIHHSRNMNLKINFLTQLAYAKLDAKQTTLQKSFLNMLYVIYCFFLKKGFLDGYLGLKYHLLKFLYFLFTFQFKLFSIFR